MAANYEDILVEHYRALIEQYGPGGHYSKTHWEGCERSGEDLGLNAFRNPSRMDFV